LRFFTIFILLLGITLNAHYEDLTIEKKEELLKWVNKYCNETHSTFEDIKKDRYFLCKKTNKSNFNNYPKELYGNIKFYEEGIDKHTIKELAFFGVLYFIAIIIFTFTFLIYSNPKNNFQQIMGELSKIRFIAIFVFTPFLLGSIYTYDYLEEYSKNVLYNGKMDEIEVALPIYNFFGLDKPPIMLAVSGGSFDLVKFLIEEKGEDPNVTSKTFDGRMITLYEKALINKSYDISNYLRQYVPKNESIDILIASRALDLDLLKKSLESKEYSKENILDAFIVSIRGFDYEAMHYLYSLESSVVSMQADRFTSRLKSDSIAIEEAVKSNNLEAFKFLLSKNAKLISETAYGPRENIYRIVYHEIISKVVYADNIKFFNLLLENGYEIKTDKEWMMKNIFLPIATGIKRGESKKIEKIIIDKGWITKKEMQKIKDDVYYGQI